MSVTIKVFASLREELGFNEKQLENIVSVSQAWEAVAGSPPPANLLCALNHEYVEFEREVRDGDEVAFFPPVNGG